MRNQRGVTLIALVITIIVLLILAGVSIAMLTGDNGILTQANNAKVSQIEGQVKEEVNLAIQAVKMYAEQQAVQNPEGWLAEEKIGDENDGITDKTVIGQLRNDLVTAGGAGYVTIAETTQKNTDDSTPGIPNEDKYTKGVKITYTSSEYKSATNNNAAQIDIYVGIDGNTFEVGSIVTTPRTK